MSAIKTSTLKRTERRFSVYPVQTANATDQQQQKQNQEKLQQQQMSHKQEKDQEFQYQDDVQIIQQVQGQIKQEIKQEQYLDQGHEQEQNVQCQDEEQTQQQEQRNTRKEIKQEQKLELGHEQEQNVQCQDEEQTQQQEQRHTIQVIKLEQELELGQGHEQEHEQTEDPQLQTEPSLEVEKVSKHTQTQKEHNFWHWVPHRIDDSPWECLVKGKGQEILGALFTSKSTTQENVSRQQRGTMPATESAQHRTQGRTNMTQPHTHCSNPAHGARPMGMQHRCQHSTPSAGCSHYAQGTRHYCQLGIPHGCMSAPQMLPPEMQPACNMGLHPEFASLFGVPAPDPAPMQNSTMPQEPQQPSNANVQRPPVTESILEVVQTTQEYIECILEQYRRHPELTPAEIGITFRRIFLKILGELHNRAQQMLDELNNGPQQ